MKAIQLKKTVIDIPFEKDGETVLTLHFDRSDAHVKQFYSLLDNLEKKVVSLEEKENLEWQDTEATIKEITDAMLGEGSFEEIYQLNPSLSIVTQYLYMIAIGIKEELEEEDLKAVESKYLS